jgi:protease-4
MAQQRSASGFLPVAISLGVIAAVGVSALIAVVGIGLFSGGESIGRWKPMMEEHGVDEYPSLGRTWSYGSGETTVMRIPVSGVLTRSQSSGVFGDVSDPVGTVLACIQDATQDEEVMAIILEIDSPGGEVTASDVIYKALLDFKKARKGRKVVALFGDVAASGAFYIAMAADYIVVQPTTITGSIGVLISTMNFKGLGDMLGVKDVTIKSGPNKDLLNPLREITPAEKALVQAVVDDIYVRFVKIVCEGRHLEEPAVKLIADGRILTAQQALDAKLVDEIGYWDDTVKKTAELLGEDEVKVFRYEHPRLSLLDMLTASATADKAAPFKSLLEPKSPRLMYLWNP